MLALPTIGLRHLALRVSDPEATKAFYCEVFGMRVVWAPDLDNIYLSTGTEILALHRAAAARTGGEGQALDHLGFLVRTPQAVRAAEERLRARGVPIVAPTRTHRDGSCSVYCLDPDGNRVQILFEPHASQR